MAGQCLFICAMSYTYRSVESWDKKKVASLKRILWAIVVESRWGLDGKITDFDLKYVPEYSTLTELHSGKGPQVQRSRIEMRNLKVFVAGISVLAVVGYVVFWVARTLTRLVI
jgi:hypothetical protein